MLIIKNKLTKRQQKELSHMLNTIYIFRFEPPNAIWILFNMIDNNYWKYIYNFKGLINTVFIPNKYKLIGSINLRDVTLDVLDYNFVVYQNEQLIYKYIVDPDVILPPLYYKPPLMG